MPMNPDDHSVTTITDVDRNWPNITGLDDMATIHTTPPLKASASSVQLHLDGLEYKWGKKWCQGHITLSPCEDKSCSMYFDSAHLTLSTKGYQGGYFFDVDCSGSDPGNPPKKFKGGKDRKNYSASQLPQDLQKDVGNIITRVALGWW